jgi:hypothetical protein
MARFRPWGRVGWLADRLPQGTWTFIGSLSTEERCLVIWSELTKRCSLGEYSFVRVQDPPSRFDTIRAERLASRLSDFSALGGDERLIVNIELHASHELIVNYFRGKLANAENVILDISTFPKRFFFPLVRLAYESDTVKNLLVTYSVPGWYSNDDLSEDPLSWAPLPMFIGPRDVAPDLMVIGVGFDIGGLSQVLESFLPRETEFLLPVQHHPSGYRRSWQIIKRLNDQMRTPVNPTRVDTWDVSACFDHLVDISEHGHRPTVLVPYGPKTISLAMCLFATGSESAVYYAQPRTYNPLYSQGVAQQNGETLAYAYSLKLGGRPLYSLE